MYHHITGTLVVKQPGEAVLEAGGVGYRLRISLNAYAALPPVGARAKLLTHLHVAEGALSLIGFASETEREFFLQLSSVSGVGLSTALAILSAGRVEDLRQAVRLGDVASLKRVKGVGDRTARRILLELGRILVREETARAKVAKVAKAGKKTKRTAAISGENTGGGGQVAAPAGEVGGETGNAADTMVVVGGMNTLDTDTEAAVQVVCRLQEVTSDVALRAVQRAYAEYAEERAEGKHSPERPAVSEIARRALCYTG